MFLVTNENMGLCLYMLEGKMLPTEQIKKKSKKKISKQSINFLYNVNLKCFYSNAENTLIIGENRT